MSETGKLKKRAKSELEDLKLILRRAKKKGDPQAVAEAAKLGDELRSALKEGAPEAIEKAMSELDSLVGQKLAAFRPNQFLETIKALLIAVAIALFIRWGFVEPFRIPSGSMIPTLLVGDQLLVNKMSFGPDIYVPVLDPKSEGTMLDRMRNGVPLYTFNIGGHKLVIEARKLWLRRLPKRGEVVVFRYPNNPREDYIKRVIGLPGDTIEMRDGRLYVNGVMQADTVEHEYHGPVGRTGCPVFDLHVEDLVRKDGEVYPHDLIYCRDHDYGSYRNTVPRTVPQGMLFMMGDNRDQSADSRSWGFAPAENLKGKALFIHLPLDPDRHYLPRWSRFFKVIR